MAAVAEQFNLSGDYQQKPTTGIGEFTLRLAVPSAEYNNVVTYLSDKFREDKWRFAALNPVLVLDVNASDFHQTNNSNTLLAVLRAIVDDTTILFADGYVVKPQLLASDLGTASMMLESHKKTPITQITVTAPLVEKSTLQVISGGFLVWKNTINYPTQDMKLTLQLQVGEQTVNMQLRLTGINADVKVARDLLSTRLKEMSTLTLNCIENK